jgi:hypothetical protein
MSGLACCWPPSADGGGGALEIGLTPVVGGIAGEVLKVGPGGLLDQVLLPVAPVAIDGPVVGGTAPAVLFVGAGNVLAQDPTHFSYSPASREFDLRHALQSFHPTTVDGDNGVSFMRVFPDVDPGPSQFPAFSWAHERALVGGVYNHVVKVGWNLPNDASYNPALGSVWDSWEGEYQPVDGAERHIAFKAPGGGEVRAFSAIQNWTTGFTIASTSVDEFKVLNDAASYVALIVQTSDGGSAIWGAKTFLQVQGSVYGPMRFTDGGAPTYPVGVGSEGSGSSLNLGANDGRFGTQVTASPGSFMQISPTEAFLFLHRAATVAGGSIVATINTDGALALMQNVALFAGGSPYRGISFHGVTGNPLMGVFPGSGAPAFSAAKGALYLRSDGTGPTDRLYVATDSVGGWTAVVTVA